MASRKESQISGKHCLAMQKQNRLSLLQSNCTSQDQHKFIGVFFLTWKRQHFELPKRFGTSILSVQMQADLDLSSEITNSMNPLRYAHSYYFPFSELLLLSLLNSPEDRKKCVCLNLSTSFIRH